MRARRWQRVGAVIAAVTAAVALTACSSHKSAHAASSALSSASSSAPAPSSSSVATTTAPPTRTVTRTATPRPSPSVSDEGGRLPGFPSATTTPDLPKPATQAGVRRFVTSVFNDAQAEWQKVFQRARIRYVPARLVLFSQAVRTACGTESSEVGPFYCPADRTVYLDVLFFDDMERRYGVKGDFSQAYVVAHEVGHHIQNITGLSSQVAQLQAQNPAAANGLSVRTELQADCYAGVWAHSTYERGLLEPGDLDEALKAAATVGDDFLQKSATGTINPEQWTHGSSAQRQQWLQRGYDSGQPGDCDTFTR
jgi:uncharacterized protein